MKSASFDCTQDKRGFTLIELLVVISIIAILSVVGITVFTGVQKNSRDARRKSDINAIAQAMEVNRNATGYLGLQSSWFASGIPKDPRDPGFEYCAGWGSVLPSTPSPFTTCASISQWWAKIGPNSPGGIDPYWKVCTSLESSVSVYCRSNTQ